MAIDMQPAWYRLLQRKYTSQVAHAFILHWNVYDYAVPGRTLYEYLRAILAQREIIAKYNRAEGITFPDAEMKDRALAILGLGAQPGTNDPFRAALAGVAPAGGGEELPRAPSAALPLLEKLLRSDARVAVILDYAETLVPAADLATMSEADRAALVLIQRWGRDAEIAAAGNLVMLVTPNLADLHPALRAASARFEAIEVPLPDEGARLAYCEELAEELKGEALDWRMTPRQLAIATAGLGLVHVQDIVLRAQQEGAVTPDLVRERKAEIVASEFGEVLEIREPRFNLDSIGGLDHVKRYLERGVIKPLRTGNTKRCPAGLLFTGPAGTGKTAVAEATAGSAGVNFVSLNLGRILGGYVGQSERNLERALKAIQALAPVIVMIDEIDQTVTRGQGQGDSGVSSRIFKRLLEFMSDTLANRGKVLVIAATNRPDLLDAALRRPGRLDKKIPFLVPDATERPGILATLAMRHGLALGIIGEEITERTEGWTGAEMEAAILKAIELVEDADYTPERALLRAVCSLNPSTSDIEYMTMLALAECNDADLLPEKYRAQVRDRKALEERVESLAPRQRQARTL